MPPGIGYGPSAFNRPRPFGQFGQMRQQQPQQTQAPPSILAPLKGPGDLPNTLLNTGLSVFPYLQSAAPGSVPVGYETLQNILMGRGQTDPMLMNQELAAISRATQGQQDALQGRLAAGNLQGSGVGQALQTAIGASGAEQAATRRAQETQAAEARKRQDLELLMRLLIDPAFTASGQRLGLNYAPDKPSDFESLLAGAAGVLGNLPGIGG